MNFLGRIPVSNTQELSTIMSKIIAYEKADNLGNLSYLKNNLYADAYLSISGGLLYDFYHSDIKSYAVNVPVHINNKYICDNANCTGSTGKYSLSGSQCYSGPFNQGDIELNRNNFLSCLNTGANLVPGKFHFIYHIDHSGPPSLNTSSKDKGQNVRIDDIDNLSNGTSWQILFSGGCKPANFYYDCIGKHYLINPSGGGVVFIGNTDVGWIEEHPHLNNFLQSIYSTQRYDIASAFHKAMEFNLTKYSNTRNTRWRLHLLGDPEMQVWTNKPNPLTVTVNTPSIYCQTSAVSVTVSGLQNVNEKIRICLYKENEVFEVFEKYGNNTYTFPNIYPITAGNLHVTVTAHDYIPEERTIPVLANSTPHIYISNITINDDQPRGNGDGQPDAGETIELEIELTNNGLAAASGVTAQFSCSSLPDTINITSAQASFGNISAGHSQTSLSKYVFKIGKNAPQILKYETDTPVFTLYISDNNGNNFTRTFNMEIFSPELQLADRKITGGALSSGQTVSFNAGLLNTGRAEATGLTAVLKDNSSNVLCTRSYPDIGRNKTEVNTLPFQFQMPSPYSTGSALNLKLEIENKHGRIWNLPFNLAEQTLPKPSGIDFTADTTSIYLYWNVQTSSRYNVYRWSVDANDNPVGDSIKVNAQPLTFAYFPDTGLEKLTKYYYKIVPVSSSGKEGTAGTILAWTSLNTIKPFPVQMEFNSFISGVQAVDVNGNGYQEIFASTKYENIAGLDHQGIDLFDIDNNVTTHSGFAKVNAGIYGSLAIGDILGNGEVQLAGASHVPGTDNLRRVFCFSMKDEDNDNKPDPVWITTTSEACVFGITAANVDNSPDGSKEIIVPNNGNTIDVYFYDFANKILTKKNIVSGNGSILNSVAVADLVGNGKVEIIRTSFDGIYAWSYDSTTSTFIKRTLYSLPAGSGWDFKSSPVVCDIDNDGEKEVLAIAYNAGGQGKVYAIKLNGNVVQGWQFPVYNGAGTELTVGDLDKDGNLEIVAAGTNAIKVWNNLGYEISSIPIVNASDASTWGTPVLADVDSNPDDIEIILGSTDKTYVYAFKMDGSKVLGFPLIVRSKMESTVCVSDINNDGKNELIAATHDGLVYVWETEGKPENIEWGRKRYDQYNTGEYSKCLKPVIRKNTTWNTNRVVCDDIIVESGTLTLSSACTLTMKDPAMIIVKAGANLVIDGGSVLDANIKAMPLSSVTMKNNAYIKLRKNGEFNILLGATFDLLYGEIDITPQ